MLTSNQTLGWWIEQYGSIQDSRNFGGVVPAYPIFMFAGIIAVIIATIIKMKMKRIPLAELYWGILITVPVGLLGGTIFGKVFMVGQQGFPASQWYHIFFFWEPGMSLFGALAIGTLAGFGWFYKRSKETRISMWVYADLIIPNILLGQAIGRWGNMYNHEIMGQAVSYESLQWLIPGIRNKLFYWQDAIGQMPSIDGLPFGQMWSSDQKQIIDVQYPNGQDWAGWLHDNISKSQDAQTYIKNLDWQSLSKFMQSAPNGGLLNVGGDPGYRYTLTSADYDTVAKVLCGELQFHAPLFLYESLSDFALWLILTFIVPNLSRWIQPKGKYPWDITPKAYPGWFNKKYKEMPLDEIESWTVQRPIKYKKSADGKFTISFWEAWNKAYYLYEPNSEEFDELVLKQDERNDYNKSLQDSLIALQQKHKNDLYRLNENFERKSKVFSKTDARYAKLHNELVEETKANNLVYKEVKKNLKAELGGWRKTFAPKPDAEKLEHVYNPHNFFILRSGVLTGSYIFGYLIIRITLEAFRRPQEYFIQNSGPADFIVLAIILLTGLVIIFLTQFIYPYKYREAGWLYEKSY